MADLDEALSTIRDIIENRYESKSKPIEIEELNNKNVSYYNPFDFVNNNELM